MKTIILLNSQLYDFVTQLPSLKWVISRGDDVINLCSDEACRPDRSDLFLFYNYTDKIVGISV